MATAQSKLDILIAAKNEASGPLKQIGSDAGGLEGALNKIGPALVASFSVAAIAQIAETGFELARTGAQAERLGTAFDGLAAGAGQVGDEMLDQMQRASRGTIANTDLMLAANKSMLLGVADTGDEMAGLLEVAAARGKAMGESTKDAFSDIVTGIGRLSPMILDNLGIVVDAKSANEAYAASIGKTAAQLSEQEQKQALVNAVIRDSTDIVNANKAAGADAADNFERMDASIQNAKEALGQLFAPAVAAIAEQIATATQKATEAMEGMAEANKLGDLKFDAEHSAALILGLTHELEFLREEEERLGAEHQKGSADWRDLQSDIRETEAALEQMQSAQLDYNRAALEASASSDAAAAAILEVDIQLNNMGAATGIATAGMERVGLSASAAKERLAALKAQADATAAAINAIENSAIGTLESAASRAVSVMGSSQVSQIYAEQKQRLDAQIKALEAVGYNTDELKFKSQELAEKAALPFTLATEAAAQADKDAKSYAKTLSGDLSDAAREAEQAFNDLKGKVAGVLQGALDTGTGVDPDKVLEKLGIPRPDAINENARRLADIAANGLKGQDWLGAFQQEVPDIWQMLRLAANPQEEAAHLLRDFQDGLLTSAIDKDKAKEIVKRQILGDQNMAELATEIANELAAEMGVPLQQALGAAQGALGVSGTSGAAGGSAAGAFADGANAAMDESNAGGSFIDKFVAQTQAAYGKLKTAGSEAGKQWGSEFLATVGANVPPALVDMLVTLTTPGVISAIAQRNSLTGAAQ